MLREHRGRSLGLLVKVAVLDELARSRPSARRVHTWNAEENRHMLAINVALGFAPAGVEAEWQLVLDTSPALRRDRCPHRSPAARPDPGVAATRPLSGCRRGSGSPAR